VGICTIRIRTLQYFLALLATRPRVKFAAGKYYSDRSALRSAHGSAGPQFSFAAQQQRNNTVVVTYDTPLFYTANPTRPGERRYDPVRRRRRRRTGGASGTTMRARASRSSSRIRSSARCCVGPTRTGALSSCRRMRRSCSSIEVRRGRGGRLRGAAAGKRWAMRLASDTYV